MKQSRLSLKLILLIFLWPVISYAQDSVIGQGTRFEQGGVLVSGSYKIMYEKELLNSIVVDENGTIYIFQIISTQERDSNAKSSSFDINCKNGEDRYYLSLTISKVRSDCFLLIFEGSKADWYPQKAPVRSFGFHNY